MHVSLHGVQLVSQALVGNTIAGQEESAFIRVAGIIENEFRSIANPSVCQRGFLDLSDRVDELADSRFFEQEASF